MSTPLLIQVAPEIDTNPTSFYRGVRRVGPVIGSRSALSMSVHPTYFDLTTPLFASAGSRKEQCSHRGQEGRTSEISQTPELLFGTAAVVSSSGDHCSSRYLS